MLYKTKYLEVFATCMIISSVVYGVTLENNDTLNAMNYTIIENDLYPKSDLKTKEKQKEIVDKNISINIYKDINISEDENDTTRYESTYKENYSIEDKNISKNYNLFMHGNFDKIIRYEMIEMSNYNYSDSRKTVAEIIETLKVFKHLNKIVKVSIIGHTNENTDDENELTIESNTYANTIIKFFKDDLSKAASEKKSKSYAKDIQNIIVSSGVDKNITYLEERSGLDLAFSDATKYGRDMSNRVMVTLYINEPVDIDSDKDGVFDRLDKCPHSARGFKVDKHGCPIDTDGDGVIDYKDKCPNTLENVSVDKSGCPFDNDKDGVLDYKDDCLGTQIGLAVDPNGCAIKSTLKINFKTSSDRILQESYSEIKKFAEFMSKSTAYKARIIGHTDSRGKAVVNMELSKRRAESTKMALIGEGIEEYRLEAVGRGELDPLQSNRTAEGRRVNRRIEIGLIVDIAKDIER